MTGRPVSRMGWTFFSLTALALSVGWGIRGNFGHEYGAMIPGALAAMAVVLLSGRDDWHRRVAYFAMFGALGWSFGGSMSYMQVVAYTHSGHSPSVLYGFACLFVIGFLWAALGGAGTAFPGVRRSRPAHRAVPADDGRLRRSGGCKGRSRAPGLVAPKTDHDPPRRVSRLVRHRLACGVAGGSGGASRLSGSATARPINLADPAHGRRLVGGFAVLVLGLRLRMTPPRGDNWAGCLGMTVGLFVYLRPLGSQARGAGDARHRVLGGIGFAAASMLKLVEITSGLETNWHSILEQTTGLFNGLAARRRDGSRGAVGSAASGRSTRQAMDGNLRRRVRARTHHLSQLSQERRELDGSEDRPRSHGGPARLGLVRSRILARRGRRARASGRASTPTAAAD